MPRTKNALRITDIRIAVAKEGFHVDHWRYDNPPTITQNATKVQFEIEKLKNERRANSTKKKLRNASKAASRSSATKKNKKRRL